MYRCLRWPAVVAWSTPGVIACLLFFFHQNAEDAAVSAAVSEPGLTYTNQRVARVPWSIHIVKIDRAQSDLTFCSAHARGKVLGVSLIGSQARGIPRELGRAIAGVNGDFYVRDNPTYAGDPRGLQILNGELISAPDTVSVWFDRRGNPHLDEVTADFTVTWPNGRKTPFGLNEQRSPRMAVLYTPSYGSSTPAVRGRELVLEKEGPGPWLPLQASGTYRARVGEVSAMGNTRLAPGVMVLSLGPRVTPAVPEVSPGMVLQISTATTPDLAGVQTAIGGGPALIKEGQPFAQKRPIEGGSGAFSERSKYERHPRAAIGWSPTHVYLVVVDGRQPGLSVGMRLTELAQFLLSLGCKEAMNFDGGKSAQMWLNGRTVNSPVHGEDPVANCLLVLRKSSAASP
jgi:large repetitive protein